MRRPRRITTSAFLLLIGAVTVVAVHGALSSAAASSGVPGFARPRPTYLPHGAKLLEAESGVDRAGGRAYGWMSVYSLPGSPAPRTHYPFRWIEINTFTNGDLPGIVGGWRGAPAEEARTTSINGVRARLYRAHGPQGTEAVEWRQRGVVTQVMSCNTCGVSVGQLEAISRSLLH